ncbi:hypothetical protein FMM05_06775 [Flavobacterium zepuense]|uniref:Lipoprotein n=1 Tax=Flavobacterium zepuense TaxID=2593302 RepID=A0A552V639_9FLAO|nr:hypothetical protein [Flavobacterium zepuense]TRW25921.1 hypothetical protein FMM05_06775 [Flavobacterium zepuense]
MKKLLPLLLLLALLSCSDKEKPDYNIQITAVKQAFEQKKIDPLQPYLAIGYTIKGLPEGLEALAIPQILQQVPAPIKYEIKSEAKEEMGTRVKALFYYADGKPKNVDFLIAGDGKILELNIMNDAKIDATSGK